MQPFDGFQIFYSVGYDADRRDIADIDLYFWYITWSLANLHWFKRSFKTNQDIRQLLQTRNHFACFAENLIC